MRETHHSALVAQPPSRVFALINDIESYPRFIPWCTHSSVLSRSERQIVATIGVQRGPLQGEFTTRNDLEADRRVTMNLVDGPFRMLQGEWLLSPITLAAQEAHPGSTSVVDPRATLGCRVELSMKFAFKNPLTAVLFEQKFAETTGSLLDAFVARMRTLPP